MINNYNYNNTMNIKGNGNFENKINNNKIELDLALKIFSFFEIQKNITNKTNENKLKNYILSLSKKIIEKYNIKNININNIINNINDNDNKIKKKYEKILFEYKINLDKLKIIHNENNQIKLKYAQLCKNFQKYQQKFNNSLNINNSSKNQKQIINRNTNKNDELSISQKLCDITKLSHQNSLYLIEMNALQKEKENLLKLLEKNKKEKNKSSFTNLNIYKNNFYIKSKNSKNNVNYFNNIIKGKEESIEKFKREINKLNINISKLNEEIKQKNNDLEIKNNKINELNIITSNNEKKIKELIDQKITNEKNAILNEDQIQKLTKENDQYINDNKKNINEINNLKNTINDLQKKLSKQNSNTNNNININANNNNHINTLFNSNNDELYAYSIKDGKDMMTPSFLSFDKNSKNVSLDGGENSNDLGQQILNNSNNKNILNEYESKIKLLKESNNQLIKELNDIKNNNNGDNENENGINGNKKIYKPEEYLIICDKNKDGLKWLLLKNKKYENCKNSYNNLFWVNIDSILDIKKYNKFKSEEDEINEIIINNVKKLEEKEEIISKLNYKIQILEFNIIGGEMEEEEPPKNKKKIHKSKSETNLKNKINNSQNIFINNNKKVIIDDNEQNLNDNIKDDFSKNQYFYLEGNGLGLLNNDKD